MIEPSDKGKRYHIGKYHQGAFKFSKPVRLGLVNKFGGVWRQGHKNRIKFPRRWSSGYWSNKYASE